jgi:hypothetical protein
LTVFVGNLKICIPNDHPPHQLVVPQVQGQDLHLLFETVRFQPFQDRLMIRQKHGISDHVNHIWSTWK